MKHVRAKDIVARDPAVIVLQDGTGPAAGGLWNTSIMVRDKLVLSSPDRYCLGGVTVQERDENTGLFGKKEFIDVPGGAIAWWPGGGFLTYEGQWATVVYHPVDSRLHPLPNAGYPVLVHVGIPDFPNRPGQNISAGDITGDGKPDIIITSKDWNADGYFPDGNRWSSPGYQPYQQRMDFYGGNDPRRDENLPFWGSKELAPFQAAVRYLVKDGHFRLECNHIFGGSAGEDVLCSSLPRDGPWESSLARTYCGRPPRSYITVFAGNGSPTLPNIDEDEGAFTYAGICKLESGEPVATFADAGVCILPGGSIVTVDFVGQIQYFMRVGPGLTFKELPVLVESGRISAIHGCIGTVSMEYTSPGSIGERLVISGENGLTQSVRYRQESAGLWIEIPDDHIVQAASDHFKDDILVVPSFVDSHVAILGSGAGRYTRARLDLAKSLPVASKLAPFSRLRVQAGPVGSVQGTTEERWGYTCPCAYDLTGDGGRVVISGDISEYIWLVTQDDKRIVLKDRDGKPVRVAWRVRPAVFSILGHTYLVTLDLENRCTVFQLDGVTLHRIGVVTNTDGSVFGVGKYGGSRGRLKFEAIRGQGKLPDLLIGASVGTSLGGYTTQLAVVGRLRSRGSVDQWSIESIEIMGEKEKGDFTAITFGHHCCAPATIPENWDGRSPKQGKHIVVGAEDGRLYYFSDPVFFTI